jgi:hypothetical protein
MVMRHVRPLVHVALVFLLLAPLGCGGEESVPRATFYDFLGRADRTPLDVVEIEEPGVFTDIRGAWLFNVDLRPLGDVQLELRVTVTEFEPAEVASAGARIAGEFHFPDDPIDAEPLTTWEAEYGIDGRFAIRSGFVRIDADRSPIEDTAVEVEFILDVIVLDEQTACGQVTDPESITFLPIILELPGTTFGAERYDPTGPVPTGVPLRCPFTQAGPDAGPIDTPDAGTPSDAGDADGSGEGGELQPPDIDLGGGQRADITGRFWFSTKIPTFPLGLNFIADVVYRESSQRASLDGTLRTDTSDPGAPAAGVFSTEVDEGGLFEVVIIGLVAEGSLTVEADVALLGQIVDEDTFCGAADGAVFAPLALSLTGTTFGAVRIADDATEAPDNAIDACP